MLAVDEHNPSANPFGERTSLLCEGRGRREDALGRLRAFQTTRKTSNIGLTDRVIELISFGLNVDAVESKSVLVDDAVEAVISASANCPTGILAGATISMLVRSTTIVFSKNVGEA